MLDDFELWLILVVIVLVVFILGVFPYRHPHDTAELDTISSTRATSMESAARNLGEDALERGLMGRVERGRSGGKRASKVRPGLGAVLEQQEPARRPLLNPEQLVMPYGTT